MRCGCNTPYTAYQRPSLHDRAHVTRPPANVRVVGMGNWAPSRLTVWAPMPNRTASSPVTSRGGRCLGSWTIGRWPPLNMSAMGVGRDDCALRRESRVPPPSWAVAVACFTLPLPPWEISVGKLELEVQPTGSSFGSLPGEKPAEGVPSRALPAGLVASQSPEPQPVWDARWQPPVTGNSGCQPAANRGSRH